MGKTRSLGEIRIAIDVSDMVDEEDNGDSLVLLEPVFKTVAEARSHMKTQLDEGKYVILRLVERCELKSELVRKTVLVTR